MRVFLPWVLLTLVKSQSLTTVGKDPSAGTLGACQGDCDSDATCRAGHVCIQRDGTIPIPGCTGSGTNNYDYCVPVSEISKDRDTVAYFGSSPTLGTAKLGQCAGDCDSDSDCKEGLKCLQRDGWESLMGCKDGRGNVQGGDYCIALPSPPSPHPPPPSPPPPPPPAFDGTIIGIAVGGVIVVLLIVAAVIWFVRSQRKPSATPPPASSTIPTTLPPEAELKSLAVATPVAEAIERAPAPLVGPCGHKNEPGAIFCGGCGSKLTIQADPLIGPCGHKNEPGANFCGGCGSRLMIQAV